MRITDKSISSSYLRQLEDVQNRVFENNYRIASGQQNINLSDNPMAIVDVKKLTTMITQNENYVDVVDDTLAELLATEEQLGSISEALQKMRQIAVDATNVGNMGNLSSLAVYIKGILNDIVKDANRDYNGHYLFSGTKTTADSITPTPPEQNSNPFEIVFDTPTEENRSGMRVVFKGNNEDRAINKDNYSSEVINTKANEIFGANGTEVFDSIVDLYNLLQYNADGSTRDVYDVFSKDEQEKLDVYQAKLGKIAEEIDGVVARNGIRSNRLTLVSEQLTNQNLLLKEYRSQKGETDVAETSLNLARDQNALQYSLKVGGNLFQNSLFDFLG